MEIFLIFMQSTILLFGATYFFTTKRKKYELIFLDGENFNFLWTIRDVGIFSSMETNQRS